MGGAESTKGVGDTGSFKPGAGVSIWQVISPLRTSEGVQVCGLGAEVCVEALGAGAQAPQSSEAARWEEREEEGGGLERPLETHGLWGLLGLWQRPEA